MIRTPQMTRCVIRVALKIPRLQQLWIATFVLIVPSRKKVLATTCITLQATFLAYLAIAAFAISSALAGFRRVTVRGMAHAA